MFVSKLVLEFTTRFVFGFWGEIIHRTDIQYVTSIYITLDVTFSPNFNTSGRFYVTFLELV